MTPQTAIPLPLDKLTDFCRRHGIVRLEVFGSILREDFGPKSDVDFLVTFSTAVDDKLSLFDLVDMQMELEKMLHRNVDFVERAGVEQSHNPYRRKRILASAEVLLDLSQAA